MHRHAKIDSNKFPACRVVFGLKIDAVVYGHLSANINRVQGKILFQEYRRTAKQQHGNGSHVCKIYTLHVTVQLILLDHSNINIESSEIVVYQAGSVRLLF